MGEQRLLKFDSAAILQFLLKRGLNSAISSFLHF